MSGSRASSRARRARRWLQAAALASVFVCGALFVAIAAQEPSLPSAATNASIPRAERVSVGTRQQSSDHAGDAAVSLLTASTAIVEQAAPPDLPEIVAH